VSHVVTHVLDPNPTEIHLFLSLLYRSKIGVYTVANEILWYVEAGAVRAGYKGTTDRSAPQ
jgi:hypothetical protein